MRVIFERIRNGYGLALAPAADVGIIPPNNTRHASTDFGPACAPWRVTFFWDKQ